MEVKNFSVPVNAAAGAAYERERLAQLKALAKNAPVGAKFKWTPPKLEDDGSLAPEAVVTKGVNTSKGDWKS